MQWYLKIARTVCHCHRRPHIFAGHIQHMQSAADFSDGFDPAIGLLMRCCVGSQATQLGQCVGQMKTMRIDDVGDNYPILLCKKSGRMIFVSSPSS